MISCFFSTTDTMLALLLLYIDNMTGMAQHVSSARPPTRTNNRSEDSQKGITSGSSNVCPPKFNLILRSFDVLEGW